MLSHDARQFVAHHLAFELIAVSSCYHTESQALPAMLNHILANAELLIYRQFY